MGMVRVAVYSDQPVLLRGLETLIAADRELGVSAACSNFDDLKEHMAQQYPDLAVLDLSPKITLARLNELRKQSRECKLILWVNSVPANFALEALHIGVRGILRKTLSLEAHVKCLHLVYRGGLWYEKGLTDSFQAARRVVLTPRESQLVSMLARGMSNREISCELGVTEGTVKVYLSHLFQKSGAKDRLDLALQGLKNLDLAGIPANGQERLRSLVMGSICAQ